MQSTQQLKDRVYANASNSGGQHIKILEIQSIQMNTVSYMMIKQRDADQYTVQQNEVVEMYTEQCILINKVWIKRPDPNVHEMKHSMVKQLE